MDARQAFLLLLEVATQEGEAHPTVVADPDVTDYVVGALMSACTVGRPTDVGIMNKMEHLLARQDKVAMNIAGVMAVPTATNLDFIAAAIKQARKDGNKVLLMAAIEAMGKLLEHIMIQSAGIVEARARAEADARIQGSGIVVPGMMMGELTKR